MSNIQVFNSEIFGDIRVIELEGNNKPYAVASDIAKALGYKRPNDAITQHCSNIIKHDIPHPQSSFKKININLIQEEDILRLIQKSKVKSLEDKTDFSNWLISHNLISDSIILETRKEIEFLSTLEKILKPMNYSLQQQLVDGAYKLDGYISELDLVIEYDENGHKHYDQAKERIREDYIRNKYKHLIRVTDKTDLHTNIGIVMNKIIEITR